MPDEWSSSTVTFATAGDWAKWTFNVPDATAASNLNGASGGAFHDFAVRAGMNGASQSRNGILIFNDYYFKIMGGGPNPSTAGWVSADRFQLHAYYATQGFAIYGPASNQTITISGLTPFVVGTNTLRYMAIGASADFQLDLVLMMNGGTTATGNGYSQLTAYQFGNDTTAETKPADYDTHVNPNPTAADANLIPTYLFKGNEATTGTADVRPLELRKFCQVGSNYLVTVHIEDAAGNPAAGHAGTSATPTMQQADLDAGGDVTFLVASPTSFWYGGSDDVAPATLILNYATQPAVNCGGWTAGAIGMSQ